MSKTFNASFGLFVTVKLEFRPHALPHSRHFQTEHPPSSDVHASSWPLNHSPSPPPLGPTQDQVFQIRAAKSLEFPASLKFQRTDLNTPDPLEPPANHCPPRRIGLTTHRQYESKSVHCDASRPASEHASGCSDRDLFPPMEPRSCNTSLHS